MSCAKWFKVRRYRGPLWRGVSESDRCVNSVCALGTAWFRIAVVFHSGTKQEESIRGEIVAADPERDLAVLKVSSIKELPKPIDCLHEPELAETMPIYTFGFPFGKLPLKIEKQLATGEFTLNRGVTEVYGCRKIAAGRRELQTRQGPEGMTLSEDGKLRWSVPARHQQAARE